MPLKLKAKPSWDTVLAYMQNTENDIRTLERLNEVSEMKDVDHFLFETVVSAIYDNPQDFWDSFNRVLN